MMQKTLFENENMIEPLNPAFCIGAVSRSTFYQGDCLVEMDKIADKSIDMILCDLPYGTTACKWDTVIPFEPLWKEYERLIKPNGAIVLTSAQPFTSALIMSNPTLFKYEWIWHKHKGTGHLNAKRQPMSNHENILVFGKPNIKYNPQMTEGEPYNLRGSHNISPDGITYNGSKPLKVGYSKDYDSSKRYPLTIQKFDNHNQKKNRFHPTQKPIELMEYLIKTYTNEGETVLDNCMGSGTTGVACKKIGRHFIGIEKDEKYFEIAVSRVSSYCA
jgi:site-specific DNA-methyltransferase (adenine-specific)